MSPIKMMFLPSIDICSGIEKNQGSFCFVVVNSHIQCWCQVCPTIPGYSFQELLHIRAITNFSCRKYCGFEMLFLVDVRECSQILEFLYEVIVLRANGFCQRRCWGAGIWNVSVYITLI